MADIIALFFDRFMLGCFCLSLVFFADQSEEKPYVRDLRLRPLPGTTAMRHFFNLEHAILFF